jgi:hypothetical protein
MRGRVRRVGVVLVVVLGCTPDSGSPAPSAGSAPPATPAVPALRIEPLTVDELRARPALGIDVRAQPVVDPAEVDVARIDVPCVGPVPLPEPARAVVRAFRASFTLTVEAMGTVPDATNVVSAIEGQLGSGCAAGPPVYAPLPLPEIGHRRVGWIDLRPAPGRPERTRTVALVAADDRLGLLVVVTDRPIAPDELADLVDLAFHPPSA